MCKNIKEIESETFEGKPPISLDPTLRELIAQSPSHQREGYLRIVAEDPELINVLYISLVIEHRLQFSQIHGLPYLSPHHLYEDIAHGRPLRGLD
jgi:hypothetical protein